MYVRVVMMVIEKRRSVGQSTAPGHIFLVLCLSSPQLPAICFSFRTVPAVTPPFAPAFRFPKEEAPSDFWEVCRFAIEFLLCVVYADLFASIFFQCICISRGIFCFILLLDHLHALRWRSFDNFLSFLLYVFSVLTLFTVAMISVLCTDVFALQTFRLNPPAFYSHHALPKRDPLGLF